MGIQSKQRLQGVNGVHVIYFIMTRGGNAIGYISLCSRRLKAKCKLMKLKPGASTPNLTIHDGRALHDVFL